MMSEIHHFQTEASVIEGLGALAARASAAGRSRHAAIWENTRLFVEAVLTSEQQPQHSPARRSRPRAVVSLEVV